MMTDKRRAAAEGFQGLAAWAAGFERDAIPRVVLERSARILADDLCAIIGARGEPEVARLAQGSTYNPTPLIAAALIYFLLLWPIVRLLSRFERRMIAIR